MKNITFIICLLLVSTWVKAQDLQSYIKEAQVNNPQIQAFDLKYSIAQEKVNEVNTLPNTTVSAGYFVSEPETRTGAQRARFSVSQMLPWFGTITARQNYAVSMSNVDYIEIAIAKRKLALAVAQSYYQLFAIEAKQKVLDQNIQLLKTYERLALTSVEVGKASAVDVLKLQIRQNEMRQQRAILDQDYLAEKTNFNNLLNRKETMSIDVVPEMTLPLEDPIYLGNGLELNPEILKYDEMFESIVQSELLNKKDGAPNIGFGLDYIPIQERPDMSFDDNGKDIVMPMLTFSIPIFNNRIKSFSKQNEMRLKETELQKNERFNLLQSALAKAESGRNEARIKYNTQRINLKQAKNAEEILMKNYETGTIDFNDVLDIQELQLKFQINEIEAVKAYFGQMAVINYLTNQ
ncbi:TolC family protein [Arenibacter sp. BSSL-BM3]|uniref:TolC family protein n=1 Tax=Arenibacter arenosicollis TaxID=2762274 RepID=A0ABR7QN83_9FLAO|nr:TolC family protein [Arenibacter arenosicollis]MBC8768554.1 TolC family protein [Arenibacter arenosicollis]